MENSEDAAVDGLAADLAAGLERVVSLLRALSQPSGLSMTAVATLASLEREGPRRLTALATLAGVTQPGMTQLISRLEDEGLVRREADPADGRVVEVRITDEGLATLARRRVGRAAKLAVILTQLSPEHQAALAAAVPALDALAAARRDEQPALA
jgi:DNA-binding MarR family transcriptional regulator